MIHRKPAAWAPIVFGLSLLFAAWHLRQGVRSVVGDWIVLSLGILIICVAAAYYRSAGALSVVMEQRDAKRAFTANWYSRNIRGIGALGLLLGVLFVWLGVVLLLKPS